MARQAAARPPLHVGGAKAEELLTAPYGLPRVAGGPGFGLEGSDGIDMPVEEQGAPAAGALQDCSKVDPLRIGCDVIEFEIEFGKIGADQARARRFAADHAFAVDTGKAGIDAVDADELFEELLRSRGEAVDSIVDAPRKCGSLHVFH
ncbi:hypothetical protein [Sinorhizobium medicae]